VTPHGMAGQGVTAESSVAEHNSTSGVTLPASKVGYCRLLTLDARSATRLLNFCT